MGRKLPKPAERKEPVWTHEEREKGYMNMVKKGQLDMYKSMIVVDQEYISFCTVCIDARGRVHANNWCSVGNSRQHIQAYREHFGPNGKFHATSIAMVTKQGAIEVYAKPTANDDDVLSDNRLPPLVRIAFFIATQDRPITDFKPMCALHAANGALGVTPGSPYQSETASLEMVQYISDVFKDEMKEKLASAKAIGVLVDESTDHGRSHNLAVYVSYVCNGFHHSTDFLELVELGSQCEAEALETKLLKVLEGYGICLDKVLAFTSDGASVMTGPKTGLAARMKKRNGHCLSFACAAHKIALVMSNAFSQHAALVELDDFISNITNYFASSANRKASLAELLVALEEPQLAVLQVHRVRWLSHERVVSCLRNLYDPLMDFFKEEAEKKEKGVQAIYDKFCDVNTMLHLHCVGELLVVLSKLSEGLQSHNLSYLDLEIEVFSALDVLEKQYTWTKGAEGQGRRPELPGPMSKLVRELEGAEGLWRSDHFLSINGDMEAEWATLADVTLGEQKSLHTIVKGINADIRSRIFEGNKVAKNFSVFDPNRMAEAAAAPNTVKGLYGNGSIIQLASFYGKKQNGHKAIVNEERCLIEWQIARPSLLEAAQTAKAAAGGVRIAVRDFWALQLFQLEASLPNISFLIQIMLVLEATSVEVERGFSAQNNIKTKLRTTLTMANLDALMRASLHSKKLKDYKQFNDQMLVPVLKLWYAKKRAPSKSSHESRKRRSSAPAVSPSREVQAKATAEEVPAAAAPAAAAVAADTVEVLDVSDSD